jgi:hypothetical protein
MIAGAIRPDRGSIVLDGRQIAALPSHRVARLGVIRTFQAASVFPRMTVLENLLLGVPPWWGEAIAAALLVRPRWRSAEREQVQRARGLLDRLGLSSMADTYAGQLSGGQKRLAEIGRAMMARPRLLLLDEPMAGVSRTLAPVIEGPGRRAAAGGDDRSADRTRAGARGAPVQPGRRPCAAPRPSLWRDGGGACQPGGHEGLPCRLALGWARARTCPLARAARCWSWSGFRPVNPGRAVTTAPPAGRGRGNVRLSRDPWACRRSLIPSLEVHLEGDA